MALTPDEVSRIASLARLRWSPAEGERLASQLAEVVGWLDALGETEIPEVPDLRPVAVEAEDVVGPCLPREVVLANAPAHREGWVVVPAVLSPAVREGEAA